MTSPAVNQVVANVVGPYLYSILARDLLYVGETQRHPVLRWSQHLASDGSFRTAATSRALVELKASDRVAFFAFDLSELGTLFPAGQVKNATQAVEHELHMLLRARPSLLGTEVTIISDTEKTAPRAFRRWDIAGRLAHLAAEKLRTALATL